MAEYYWMPLSMSENVWINCSDYARVFNMPRYSYIIIIIIILIIIIIIIIIIVTNGITSRRFATILSFYSTS